LSAFFVATIPTRTPAALLIPATRTITTAAITTRGSSGARRQLPYGGHSPGAPGGGGGGVDAADSESGSDAGESGTSDEGDEAGFSGPVLMALTPQSEDVPSCVRQQ
jgi:hypothetical protein